MFFVGSDLPGLELRTRDAWPPQTDTKMGPSMSVVRVLVVHHTECTTARLDQNPLVIKNCAQATPLRRHSRRDSAHCGDQEPNHFIADASRTEGDRQGGDAGNLHGFVVHPAISMPWRTPHSRPPPPTETTTHAGCRPADLGNDRCVTSQMSGWSNGWSRAPPLSSATSLRLDGLRPARSPSVTVAPVAMRSRMRSPVVLGTTTVTNTGACPAQATA